MFHAPRLLRFTLSLACTLALVAGLRAADEKIEFPATSQRGLVKQRVALTDIEVDYSRPNKNDREIYGSLVPYGQVWRTGANATTTIKLSGGIKLGDKAVPAGEYGVFTMPGAEEWTIMLSKDTKATAAEYKQENDVARVTVKPTALPMSVESFTIGIGDVKGASANLQIDWDKTRVTVPITTDDFGKLSQQLEAAAKSSTPLEPRMAYSAAVFYLENDKDLKQAEKWIDQALAKEPEAYFMNMRRAQIEQKLGNKKEATASAQKVLEILKKDKAPDQAVMRNAQAIIDSSK